MDGVNTMVMMCIFGVGSKHRRKTLATGGLAGNGICAWDGAAGALAVVEFVKGGLEIGWREIGPAFGEEDELGEGTFPEQEIGQALLAAGADEEVDVR